MALKCIDAESVATGIGRLSCFRFAGNAAGDARARGAHIRGLEFYEIAEYCCAITSVKVKVARKERHETTTARTLSCGRGSSIARSLLYYVHPRGNARACFNYGLIWSRGGICGCDKIYSHAKAT